MKGHIILLVSVILIGSLLIFSPMFLKQKKKESKKQSREDFQSNFVNDISSSMETIIEPEISDEDMEIELYDEGQIYFEGIEELYNYFKFNQVESIKEKVSFYIQQNISKDLLDCKLITNSIDQKENLLLFKLEIKNIKDFEVKIIKHKDGNIADIVIKGIS